MEGPEETVLFKSVSCQTGGSEASYACVKTPLPACGRWALPLKGNARPGSVCTCSAYKFLQAEEEERIGASPSLLVTAPETGAAVAVCTATVCRRKKHMDRKYRTA